MFGNSDDASYVLQKLMDELLEVRRRRARIGLCTGKNVKSTKRKRKRI